MKLFKLFFLFLVVAYAADSVTWFFTFYFYGKKKEKQYYNSFFHTYKTNDYNNTKIKYFFNEMKKNYTVFLYAKNNIKLFESDVKIDIARQCIENLSEKYNSDLSLDNAWNFDKNARNAIVNKKDDLIKLYTKQEKRISKNFIILILTKYTILSTDLI